MVSNRYLALLDHLMADRIPNKIAELRELHVTKNAGYSGLDNPDPWANFRNSEKFGVKASVGALVRLSDKWTRLCNLAKNMNNNMVGEGFIDTLLDLAAYALIIICLWEEQ